MDEALLGGRRNDPMHHEFSMARLDERHHIAQADGRTIQRRQGEQVAIAQGRRHAASRGLEAKACAPLQDSLRERQERRTR